jgi:hypothetical protein
MNQDWKELTDQELFDLFPEKLSDDGLSPYWEAYARAVIEAFKEKNKLKQPENKCNPHPKAPHGFNRNASHANDRYTCECESWDAYEAGYQDGVTYYEKVADDLQALCDKQSLRIAELEKSWIGLNWDDLPEIYVEDKAFLHGAQWAEAKLREKNT